MLDELFSTEIKNMLKPYTGWNREELVTEVIGNKINHSLQELIGGDIENLYISTKLVGDTCNINIKFKLKENE